MTPSELKYNYQRNNPSGHWFDRQTMTFFGDTMRNFGVRLKGNYWELYRKHPVKYGLKTSHYFSVDTFEEVSASRTEVAQ